ncbi:hypothetical protein ACN28I_31840 [Archangium gephyra]|uniref:hypothetical protein n=1 Tax=Archangium gephyra TaxID=48 RepID=UPI003B7D0029
MRRAIWMALAFMGTAPLVALAQQNTGAAPAASPSGAAGIDRGQDTTAQQAPGSPGQQSAGAIGTAQGQPATGGGGVHGTGDAQGGGAGGTGGTGGVEAGTGGGGTTGPTYRGTTQEIAPASPPIDVGTRVGPEPGEQAGGAGTGTGGGTGGTGTGTGGDVGTGVGGGTGTQGGGGGQSAMQQAPGGSEAMQRELTTLRQRVSRLEAELGALRGTGGGGTGGATPGVDTGTPGPDPEDMEVQGPVAVASAVFDGRVVNNTRKHIDIVDTSDGTFYRLTVDDQTRAFVGPDLKRIPVEQLSEGTPVRTSFALISGEERARYIVTQPQRSQQQQSERQQRQQQRQERMGPGQRMVVPPQQTPQQ